MAAFDDTSHIVRYYHAWLEDAHLYIQMEKMDYSLDELVGVSVEPLPEPTLRHIMRDCLLGLDHIHSKSIVHLDIKVGTCCLFEFWVHT